MKRLGFKIPRRVSFRSVRELRGMSGQEIIGKNMSLKEMWGGNYGDDFRNCKEEKEKNSVFQDYKGERLGWCIWEYFITLLLSSSSLPLYHFLSLFYVFCLCLLSGFCFFHSGFWVSVSWSLVFCPSLLVYVTPSDFFSLFNSGICLCLSLSLSCLLPIWISTSSSGFSVPFFYWVSTHFSLNIWSFWVFVWILICPERPSFSFLVFLLSEPLLLPFWKILKKKNFSLTILTFDFYIIHQSILFHLYMFYIVAWIIIYDLETLKIS